MIGGTVARCHGHGARPRTLSPPRGNRANPIRQHRNSRSAVNDRLLLISIVAWAIVWWIAAEVVSFSLRGCWVVRQKIRDIRTGKERLMKGDVVVLSIVALLLVFVWVAPHFAT